MGNQIDEADMSLASIKSIWRLPYRGDDWLPRFVIGSLLIFAGYLIPIFPWLLVSGYGIRVMRTAITDEITELPDWNDLGALAWDGLRAMLISLIFLLPGIVVLVGGFGLYFLNVMAVPALATSAEGGDFPAEIFAMILFGSILIFFLSLGVGNLLILIGSIPLPAVTAHFAATDRLGAAAEISTWFRLMWRNRLGYLIAWIFAFGIAGMLYFAFILGYYLVIPICFAPFVVPPILFFILVVVNALFGKTYREGRDLMV